MSVYIVDCVYAVIGDTVELQIASARSHGDMETGSLL